MFPYISGYVVLTVVIVYSPTNKQTTVSFYNKNTNELYKNDKIFFIFDNFDYIII